MAPLIIKSGGGVGASVQRFPNHPRNGGIEIRERHRYPHQSLSFNQCYNCKRIVACPFEIAMSGSGHPLCLDCKKKVHVPPSEKVEVVE